MADDPGQGGDARPAHPLALAVPTDAEIRAEILLHAHRRGRDKSFCPSEPARALSPDWRALMPRIRQIVAGMDGVEALQKGRPVDPLSARGPIRLRLRV